jgi:hypothetical protein
VRCANCHRRKTASEHSSYRTKHLQDVADLQPRSEATNGAE